MDERERVLELTTVPEIYADGVGRVTPCGPNVKLQLWTWTEISGVLQRVAVATVIRPTDSLVLSQEDVMRRVKMAKQRMLQSGIWHVIWLTTLDWAEWVQSMPLSLLGPLH